MRMIKKQPMGTSSFFIQLYQRVNDRSSDTIISWSKSNNNSFIVWDLKRLNREILPKSSGLGRTVKEFMVALRKHGFKINVKGPGALEFSHDDFARGLLKKMLSKRIEKFDAQVKAMKCRFKAKKATVTLESLFQNLRI